MEPEIKSPDWCLDKILEYTKQHMELFAAHHLLFNLPLPQCDRDNVEFIVMGINPGEHSSDTLLYPEDCDPHNHIEQETHRRDFHEEFNSDKGGREGLRWTKLIKELCGSMNVVQTEAFFWSSPRSGAEFENKFGYRFDSNTVEGHLQFCATINRHLIQYHQPSMIIFPGISSSKRFARMYELRPTKKEVVRCSATNHRLIEEWTYDGEVPWIFTKHWTGGRGFSLKQRQTIGNYIRERSSG